MIVVTGSEGFLGKHLTAALTTIGLEAFGIDRKSGWTCQAFDNEVPNVQAIVHLAADTQVGWCYKHPLECLENNVGSALSMIRLAQNLGVPIIVGTTDKVYIPNKSVRWSEDCELSLEDLHCPYSRSKVIVEQMIDEARQYKPDICSIRCGNIIGPDDPNEERLFPAIRKAFLEDKPLARYMPNARRQWVHVQDVCDAIIAILSKMLRDETVRRAYNIGGIAPWSVGDIVAEFRKQGIAITTIAAPSPFPEAETLYILSYYMHHDFGWKPKVTMHEAIAEAAAIWKEEKCKS